jgi:hypothetical protein
MRRLPNHFDTSVARAGLPIRFPSRALLLAACLCTMQSFCRSQTNGVLCSGGSGRFASKFSTGVTVTVGAQKNSAFATRACEATLIWNKKEVLVARDAWQADIDVMGADLGLGVPVVAFQIKKSDVDSRMTYEVYSLHGPPHLLRTITGGDFFRAADTDLDGRIEIWTGDVRAADGFEGLPLADFDFAPTVVMRFQNQRLIDVSPEFRRYYDRQIAQVRAQLDSRQLSDFKSSDGTLSTIPPWQVERLRGLMTTKIKVLEIVWAYLYSGREQDAWHALANMWPAADLDRIRSLIVKARAGGICSQVDGIAPPSLQLRKLKRAHVFDLTLSYKAIDPMAAAISGFPQGETPPVDSSSEREVIMPVPISLYTPPPPDAQHAFPRSGMLVDLVIDAAGKVFSARLVNNEDNGPTGESLIGASGHWKFIPAMKNGQAVASHIRLTVSTYQ